MENETENETVNKRKCIGKRSRISSSEEEDDECKKSQSTPKSSSRQVHVQSVFLLTQCKNCSVSRTNECR